MRNLRAPACALAFIATLATGTACAQGTRIQFPPTGNITTPPATVPSTSGSPYGTPLPTYGGSTTSGGGVPANTIPGNTAGGGSLFQSPAGSIPPTTTPTLGAPYSFDPYSTSPGSPNPWNSVPSGTVVQPAPLGSPFSTQPPGGFSPPASPFSSSGSPYINPGAYPSQNSNTLLPNGVWTGNPTAQPYDYYAPLKFIQNRCLTHTYLGNGNDPTDVNINDTVTSVSFVFPNFLWSGQPLAVSPTFGLHLWDGPHSLPADLPANAYSAFLDSQFTTDPNQQLGGEFGYRFGVYSDFNTMNSHSIRIQGLGLGTLKITPTMTLKIGAMYIDRNDIKILPAGGILWQPSPQVRFDFFFPQPKLASYLTTVNNKDLWWYVAGEYGGGAWTIKRTSGLSDRIDINDIRVSIGMETVGDGFNMFGEVGYVFDRHVVYVETPGDSFSPSNTFVVRAGFSF